MSGKKMQNRTCNLLVGGVAMHGAPTVKDADLEGSRCTAMGVAVEEEWEM